MSVRVPWATVPSSTAEGDAHVRAPCSRSLPSSACSSRCRSPSETTEDSLSGQPITQVLATIPTAGLIGNTVWLRMVKHGARYATYYSADGATFVPVYEVGQSLSNARVGLFSFNGRGTNSDLSVAFDYFRVSSPATASRFAGRRRR